jgi:hypothetical protein
VATKPIPQKIFKEFYTEKRKINTTMRIWERINLTRRVEKQMRIRKVSNITKITQ